MDLENILNTKRQTSKAAHYITFCRQCAEMKSSEWVNPKRQQRGGGAGVENDAYEHRVLSEVRGILELDSAASM